MGGLAGLGVPEEDARFYESGAGRRLVTARADDPNHAGRILQAEGAKLRRDATAAVPGNALPATPY